MKEEGGCGGGTDETEKTIIVKLETSTTILNCLYYMSAYSRSQTHIAFSDCLVINYCTGTVTPNGILYTCESLFYTTIGHYRL